MRTERVKSKVKNGPLTESIKKEKTQVDVKFNFNLNEEQKEGKGIFLNNSDVIAYIGEAGSGKTLLACQIALDQLFKKNYKKIIIARPAVEAGESLGFLPGDLKEKLDPYLRPIYDNMNLLYKKEKIESLVAEGVIEIIPFAFMRGRTYLDSIIICDEIQNCTSKQLKMALGRIGHGSKMILCGDEAQIDLKDESFSAIKMLDFMDKKDSRFNVFRLKKNHRHEIVKRLLGIFEQYEANENKKNKK